jgi:hypothetical protein
MAVPEKEKDRHGEKEVDAHGQLGLGQAETDTPLTAKHLENDPNGGIDHKVSD